MSDEQQAVPVPGSREAVAAGCRCPWQDQWELGPVIHQDCPLHGDFRLNLEPVS